MWSGVILKAECVTNTSYKNCVTFIDVITFENGVPDVFRRTADNPIEHCASLLGQIITLVERVDGRENTAAIEREQFLSDSVTVVSKSMFDPFLISSHMADKGLFSTDQRLL
jgi:hypothetical protein